MLEQNTQKERSLRWSHYLPILDWGLHYRREYLAGDLTAGIIVASLLIP
ncbi:hypothetical protein [Fischerella sp. NIES-3754]|nr:hypothetical protein [Fischerella sp. NIES-3754]BAU06373.1 sulfate permease [Fischerella sp. NIES-3754]BCX08664.1 MAG: hypothetical protein KatS3mg066_2523 [Fischerella sp.]